MRRQVEVEARRVPCGCPLNDEVDVLLAVGERDQQVRPAQAGAEGADVQRLPGRVRHRRYGGDGELRAPSNACWMPAITPAASKPCAAPPAEGAALWAEFDAETDRPYAVMNEGKEPDLGD